MNLVDFNKKRLEKQTEKLNKIIDSKKFIDDEEKETQKKDITAWPIGLISVAIKSLEVQQERK